MNPLTLSIRVLPSRRPLFAPRRETSVAENSRFQFDTKRVIVIGKGAAADVKLEDASVDETHALVTRKRGWYEIHDPGSARGTLVGDVPLTTSARRVLPWHAIVNVGAVRLELTYGERPYALYATMGAPDVARAGLLREQQERDRYPLRLVLVEGDGAPTDRVPLPPRDRPYTLGASPLGSFVLRSKSAPDVAASLRVGSAGVVVTCASSFPI